MARSGAPLLTVLLLGAALLSAVPARGTDTVPPWAVTWGPTGTGVPTDTEILVTWNESMNWASVESAFSYSDGVVSYTSGTWTIYDASNTSVFAPATPLQPGKRYTVKFDTTATDPAGNRLDQNRNGRGGEGCEAGPPSTWDCLVWSFDTAPLPSDTTPPRVLSESPPDGGLAATNASFEILFSETMDTASVEASFSYGDGYSLYTIGDGTANWVATSTPDDTLRFAPRLRLASGGNVAVNLNGTAARDLAGNHLDGNGDGTGGDDFAWSFAVAPDLELPLVTYTHPSPGTGSNSISTIIRITFSKAMDRGSVESALSLGATGAPTLTAANGSSTWAGTQYPDDTLYFDPYPNLRTATTYTLVLQSESARDREGRPLDGNGNGTSEGSPADDYRLAFTTESVDATPPWVTSRQPAPGETDVPPSTGIDVRFSEPMNRTSVEAAFSYTDGTSSFTSADGSLSWALASDGFTFRPASGLGLGTVYTVTLNGTTARDEAGNPLNSGQDVRWGFTTAGVPDTTSPWVQWTSPFDGQRNVSRTARVSIIFSEAMDKASVQSAMEITSGAVLTDFRWPNDATVEAATAAPMGYRTGYTVFVLTGARDLAGNPLQQPKQIAFTTEPWRGRVTGRVLDESGTWVREARVQLNGFSVLTNDTGGFAFEAIEQGTYTLTVTHPEFATYTELQEIAPGQGSLSVTLRRAGTAGVDAAIWAAVGATLLFVLLVIAFLRRRRPKPAAHYETWRPARVVTVEPGQVRQRERE